MNKALSQLVSDAFALRIFSLCDGRDADIRLVGGAVRNALSGWRRIDPISGIAEETDLDFATDMPITDFAVLAEEDGLRVYPTGLAHGTVTLSDGTRYAEVTQLRSDIDTDGRHAIVSFHQSWDADAARRDFTVNAIYLSRDGTVSDPVGGIADIQAGRLCFIGKPEDRLAEDGLRLLRALRFCAEYPALQLDETVIAALQAASGMLKQLSAERITTELRRMLAGQGNAEMLTLFGQLGLDRHILKGPVAQWAAAQSHDYHLLCEGMRLCALPLQLALIAQDKHMLKSHAGQLRLSRAEHKMLMGAIALADASHRHADKMELLFTPRWQQGCFWLGKLAAFGYLHVLADRAEAQEIQYDAHRMRQIVHYQAPLLPVTGQDIITIYTDKGQVLRGEEIGQMLAQLTRRWVESDFRLNRENLLELMQAEAGIHHAS